MNKDNKATLPSPFERVLPKELKVGKDKLILRLDFYGEVIVMQDVETKGGAFRIISPHELSHALASELSFTSGLLPANTLWWTNTRSGPRIAIWVEPGVRKLAFAEEYNKPPKRYTIPLPGLIFLCNQGQPPDVWAAFDRPKGPKDKVYHAPFPNLYHDGRSCPGSNVYPDLIEDIPDSFLRSFFSHAVSSSGRSKKYPNKITELWKKLDKEKKETYPMSDLVYAHVLVGDLMRR